MSLKDFTQVGNNLFRSSDGTMYSHRPGKRWLDGKMYHVSEGLIRQTPRRHVKKRMMKDDAIARHERHEYRRYLDCWCGLSHA